MVKIPRAVLVLPYGHATASLLTASDGQPAGDEAQESAVFPWCNGSNPVVHATLCRVAGDKLSQGCTKKGLHNCHEDEAIYDCTWPTGIDFSDNAQSQTSPGDGRRGCQTDQGQDTEVTLEFLSVTFNVVSTRPSLRWECSNIPI